MFDRDVSLLAFKKDVSHRHRTGFGKLTTKPWNEGWTFFRDLEPEKPYKEPVYFNPTVVTQIFNTDSV